MLDEERIGRVPAECTKHVSSFKQSFSLSNLQGIRFLGFWNPISFISSKGHWIKSRGIQRDLAILVGILRATQRAWSISFSSFESHNMTNSVFVVASFLCHVDLQENSHFACWVWLLTIVNAVCGSMQWPWVVVLNDCVCVLMLSCEVLCTSVCSFVWLLTHSRPCRLTVHRAVQHHGAGWLLQRPESSGLRAQPWQKATTCQSEAPRWYVGGLWGANLFFTCLPARTQLQNYSCLRWHWQWHYNKFSSSVISGRRNQDPFHPSICIPSHHTNTTYLRLSLHNLLHTGLLHQFVLFPGFWPVGVRTKRMIHGQEEHSGVLIKIPGKQG